MKRKTLHQGFVEFEGEAMEATKQGQLQIPPTPTTAQTHTLPAQSLPPLHPKTKKRPLDANVYALNFKMRAVLRDLRPHFVEVLKTPEFRNSKAAHEIQERMKLLLDLQKSMMVAPAVTPSVEKPRSILNGQSSSADNQDRRGHQEQRRNVKPGDKSSESNYSSISPAEKQDILISGAYIVGGSAFGWNFITFTGKDPVYYGVTKELYREKNPIVPSES